jgi:hypothetical protein
MMKRFLLLFPILAVIHFVLSWICFTRSEVIRPDPSTPAWRTATEILAFPLVWIQSLDLWFDAFPLLMFLNSLLWGAVWSGLILWVWRTISSKN